MKCIGLRCKVDIRAQQAQARFLAGVKRDGSNALISMACLLAERMGYHDFFNDRFEPPEVIADDPDLLSAWHFGQEDAAIDEEMGTGRKLFAFSPLAALREWKGLPDTH